MPTADIHKPAPQNYEIGLKNHEIKTPNCYIFFIHHLASQPLG